MTLCFVSALAWVAGAASPPVETSTQTEVITVRGQSFEEERTPSRTRIELGGPDARPADDAADALRGVNGVSAGRFGGHGLEPVIRGQQQNRLTVVSDGTAYMAGCMNRMDPPTAYTAIETYDGVEVTRGYHSVLDGAGASGGTVRFERAPPQFHGDRFYAGELGLGGDTNGVSGSLHGRVAVGEPDRFVQVFGALREAGRYDDGAGAEVRSAYRDHDLGLRAAYALDRAWRVVVSGERRGIDDAEYAGAPMDAPSSVAWSGSLGVERAASAGWLRRLEGRVFFSRVDHRMDNFSLRDNPVGPPNPDAGDPPHRSVDSTSWVVGGRLGGTMALGELELATVFDAQSNLRDATRYQGLGPDALDSVQSIMWPDVAVSQLGLGVEAGAMLTETTRLVVGGRYDRVLASYGRADEVSDLGGTSPNQLFDRYYGVRAQNANEDNFGGIVRVEQELGAGFSGSLEGSRSVRTADATERGIAAHGGSDPGRSWIGNPAIAPEQHHEVELGLSFEEPRFEIHLSGWADFVIDYIQRDQARGQEGIRRADGADIYRNVDARLLGSELEARWRPLSALQVEGALAYVHGDDLTDDRPLPNIPPLEGQLGLSWQVERWRVGARGRFAARQDRVDDDPSVGTGLDAGPTDAYAIADLFGSVWILPELRLDGGVTNLLDARYAHHLSRSTAFDPTVVRVNEPGRSFYLRVRGEL